VIIWQKKKTFPHLQIDPQLFVIDHSPHSHCSHCSPHPSSKHQRDIVQQHIQAEKSRLIARKRHLSEVNDLSTNDLSSTAHIKRMKSPQSNEPPKSTLLSLPEELVCTHCSPLHILTLSHFHSSSYTHSIISFSYIIHRYPSLLFVEGTLN
jgi:hypothetical protein